MRETLERELDALLSAGLVKAPDDFHDQVLHRIALEADVDLTALSEGQVSTQSTRTPFWQWLALGAASFAGAIQMSGFVFGVWAATAAG